MEKFQSTKLFDGYSCVFRQWKAEGTHCKFLHGYGVSFRVWFEGQLDERNWVWDFGGMKRAKGTIDGMNPKEWMDDMFDHTTIIAEDDPHLGNFIKMWKDGIIQLRIIPATGAEQFAKYIYQKLNTFIQEETDSRVKVTQVEFMEHNKNTAIYSESAIKSLPKSIDRQPVEGC
jgi:6-pyruvoyltetrahydropterin/6-carboxytetrahydropterin synthase